MLSPTATIALATILLGLQFCSSELYQRRLLGTPFEHTTDGSVQVDTLVLLDSSRNRPIPIAYYRPEGSDQLNAKLVLISHGYGENKPGTYLHFSSLARNLAIHGYAVASIQHELPNDETLPMKGDLAALRRPNWERGVANMEFVREALGRRYPSLHTDRIDVIGHSNGGDMAMLFAEMHPTRVGTAISLDNRRMPLPRVSQPRICSVRANDAPADPGVLPTPEEQALFGIRIIDLPDTRHVDMDDRAPEKQRAVLNQLVLDLLAKK